MTGSFTQADKHIRKAISASLDETSEFAKTTFQRLTPVRTGNLKAGWEVEKLGWDSIEVDNPVPYAIFVDSRFAITQKSIPQIEKFFNQSTTNHTLKELQ